MIGLLDRLRVSTLAAVGFTTILSSAQPFDRIYDPFILPSALFTVTATSDGGFVALGSEVNELWLLKVDHDGDTLWSRLYDGVRVGEQSSLSIASDGGLLIAGTTGWADSLGYDLYLLRTDANGQVLWYKRYGTPGDEGLYSMTLTADGGSLLVGGYIVRVDDQGDTLWTRFFGGENLIEDACIIPGSTDLMLTGLHLDQSQDRALIMRMTDSGEVIWTRLLDFGPGIYANGMEIVPTTKGADTAW